MSEQPSGEKSFAPTDKRKRDAAQKGDVLRSKEVGTAASVLAGALWLKFAGTWLMDGMISAARASLGFGRGDIEHFAPGDTLIGLALDVLPPLLVLGLVVMSATLGLQLGLAQGRWNAGNLAPKPSRLNPLSGLSHMFGLQGVIELGKGLLKLALLGAIAWWWSMNHMVQILALGRGELTGQLMAAWDAIIDLLLLLSVGLLAIALVDWPIQFLRRMSRLKMTQQEMRDEHKESEGAPEKKAAIRQRQREFARGGVAKAMREAQFIITNPTHFSVALAYDPKLAPAPIVLAKGRGDKAMAMRDLAAEMKIPALEYPALARSVYFTTRERQVIRAELYAAVASVLAFVLSLKRGEKPKRPQISVPPELHFNADGQVQRV